MNDTSIQGTQASKQLPSGATNGQIPIWNSATNRWVAGANGGGGFDPTADITFSGVVSFTNSMTVAQEYFQITYNGGAVNLKFGVDLISTANGVANFPSAWTTNTFAAQDLNNNFSVAQTFQQNISARKALIVDASAGNGYIQFGQQSANPTGVVNSLTAFADASNKFSFREGTGNIATFSNTNLSTNAVFSFPNVTAGTLATTNNTQTFTATQAIRVSISTGATDLLINPTTKTSGNLLDLQVTSSSVFRVNFNGQVNSNSSIYSGNGRFYSGNSNVNIDLDNNTNIALYGDGNRNSFNMLQFGGITASFPALKRNGATLECKFASDSGFAGFKANIGYFATLQISSPDYGGLSTPVISSTTGTTLITLADKSATFAASSILITAASTSANAGFRITPGVAPTTPVDGDVWVRSGDGRAFLRVGGVTKEFNLT